MSIVVRHFFTQKTGIRRFSWNKKLSPKIYNILNYERSLYLDSRNVKGMY